MPRARATEKRKTDRLNPRLIELREPFDRSARRPPGILSCLGKRDLSLVMSRARRLTLAPKQVLFFQGEPHRAIYIIESGMVRTYYTSIAGREITLAYWQPGDFVGGPDVFGESLHMWSGTAVRSTKVIELLGTDLRKLVKKIPDLAVGLLEALVYKGKCFSSLIQLLGTRSISERLSQLLLALSANYGVPVEGGVAIRAQLTHEDLAHMVGASRQWVTTTLDRLQRQDIVHIRKRQVIIRRPEKLTAFGSFDAR